MSLLYLKPYILFLFAMITNDYISDVRKATGVNVNKCYQCGKCSAGCVLSDDMDFPPSRVMRMLQTKNEENYKKILNSETIWLCVSCQNCLTRCPMEIDIPALMDYLRAKSLEKNLANKKSKNIISFHKSFIDSIKYTGRLYEIGLVADYKMRTRKLMQDIALVPSMLSKGKLPLLPEQIKDKKLLSEMFKKTDY